MYFYIIHLHPSLANMLTHFSPGQYIVRCYYIFSFIFHRLRNPLDHCGLSLSLFLKAQHFE